MPAPHFAITSNLTHSLTDWLSVNSIWRLLIFRLGVSQVNPALVHTSKSFCTIIAESLFDRMTMKRPASFFSLLFGIVLLPVALLAIPPGSRDEITDRIKPIGKICKVDEDCVTAGAIAVAADGPLSGAEVYNRYCFACHATGVSNAPIFGDAAIWMERKAKGLETLYSSTVNGLGVAMPPRGTCVSCSDDELRAAVDYMLEQSP